MYFFLYKYQFMDVYSLVAFYNKLFFQNNLEKWTHLRKSPFKSFMNPTLTQDWRIHKLD